MPIRHRLIKPTPLLYHRLYGSLESPPVSRERSGPEPWPPNGMQGVWSVGLIVGVRHQYFPKKLGINPVDVIAGLVRNHDAQRDGLGPDQGFSSWVANVIIERGGPGMVREYFAVNPKNGKRTRLTSQDLCDVFTFSTRSEPRRAFYIAPVNRGFRTAQEMQLEEDAITGLYLDYEEKHGIKMPWNLMKYRKPRNVE